MCAKILEKRLECHCFFYISNILYFPTIVWADTTNNMPIMIFCFTISAKWSRYQIRVLYLLIIYLTCSSHCTQILTLLLWLAIYIKIYHPQIVHMHSKSWFDLLGQIQQFNPCLGIFLSLALIGIYRYWGVKFSKLYPAGVIMGLPGLMTQ